MICFLVQNVLRSESFFFVYDVIKYKYKMNFKGKNYMQKKKIMSFCLAGTMLPFFGTNAFANEGYAEELPMVAEAYSRGDVDGDGKVTLEDAISILSIYAQKAANGLSTQI